jgi:DNA-binding MarR family transcriptional regulator
MHISFSDLVNKQIDPVNDPVNSSILNQLKHNPKLKYSELADSTGYSIATIKRHIQDLKKLGLIERIGSDKTGSWNISKDMQGE